MTKPSDEVSRRHMLIIHPEAQRRADAEAARKGTAFEEATRGCDVICRPTRSFDIGGFHLQITQSWLQAPEPDCTGHAVWSGAELLARFLSTATGWGLATGPVAEAKGPLSAIEVGCGVGCLPGLVCHLRHGLPVTFTDGSEKVLERAAKNVAANVVEGAASAASERNAAASLAEGGSDPSGVAFVPLKWGCAALPSALLPEGDGPRLILASDVAYVAEYQADLAHCLALALAAHPPGAAAALVCNAERSNTQALWHSVLAASGKFRVEDLAPAARVALGEEAVGRHDLLQLTLASGTHI